MNGPPASQRCPTSAWLPAATGGPKRDAGGLARYGHEHNRALVMRVRVETGRLRLAHLQRPLFSSGRWPRQRAYLHEDSRNVGYRPVLDDLAVANAVDRNTFGFYFFIGGRDTHEFAGMQAATPNMTYDKVVFGNLKGYLMGSRRRDTE